MGGPAAWQGVGDDLALLGTRRGNTCVIGMRCPYGKCSEEGGCGESTVAGRFHDISDHVAQGSRGHSLDLEHDALLLKMGFVTKRFYAGVVPALAMPR